MYSSKTRVYVAASEFDAQQIRALLETNAIPCSIRGESIRHTHGLTLASIGGVEIHVPESFVEEARALIEAAESGGLEIGDRDREWRPTRGWSWEHRIVSRNGDAESS